MLTFAEVLSRNLQKIMKDKGFSVQYVADKSGLHRNTISLIIKQKQGISFETIAALAGAIGVKETDLVNPGTIPEPIVKTPSPLEALKIVERALKCDPADINLNRFSEAMREILLVAEDGSEEKDFIDRMAGLALEMRAERLEKVQQKEKKKA